MFWIAAEAELATRGTGDPADGAGDPQAGGGASGLMADGNPSTVAASTLPRPCMIVAYASSI